MKNHRKYRIANKARFTAFVAIMIIAMAFVVTTALGFNTASGASTQQYVQVEVKAGDTLDLILADDGRNLLANLLVAVAALAVYGWLIKPQADIPYNKLFYWVGWGALIFNAVARAAFLALQFMN